MTSSFERKRKRKKKRKKMASAAHGGQEQEADDKVIIQLRATGNAPQLKNTKFRVNTSHTFQFVQDTVRKHLKLESQRQVYFFINTSFQPHSEESIADLTKCFASGSKLIVNYCVDTPAWG